MPDKSEMLTLTEVCGDLVLAALCIGQFRAPCQIEDDRLLVRADAELLRALGALGLRVRTVAEPFTPAPLFAPVDAHHGRRQVQHHVAHLHTDDEDEPDEAEGVPPASNA